MDLTEAAKIMRSKTSTPQQRSTAARIMGQIGGKLSHTCDQTHSVTALRQIIAANNLLIQQQEAEIARLKSGWNFEPIPKNQGAS